MHIFRTTQPIPGGRRRAWRAAAGVSAGVLVVAWLAVGPTASAAPQGTTSAAAADTDGDGLLDTWETNGYDGDGDGKIDVDLPKFGADPKHKDIFVEMDYMGAEKTCPCHLPLAEDLDRIVKAYAESPFADNPDGKPGITMHLDAGKARGSKYNLGGGNLVPHDPDLNPVNTEFSALKSKHFDRDRAKIFHYMIWAHGYGGGSSSGLSFGIPADSFVVTLGLWPNHGDPDVKVGTFIHELGHGLGLHHGGADDTNYKPNYLSVMSYAFQVGGVPRVGKPPHFSYSRVDLADLTETSLKEKAGLGKKAKKYRTSWVCPSGQLITGTQSAAKPIDWNCDGKAKGTVNSDVNGDATRSILRSNQDWGHLVYDGGTIGQGAESVPSVPLTAELTYEEYLTHRG
jgi:hypothetical protein